MRFASFFVASALGICGLSAPVWAGESSIWWPGWNISSTENLSGVYNQSLLHPLSALFDANPKTTWVMNPRATLEVMYVRGSAGTLFGKTKRGLSISGKSRLVSGLQIMNGDNSSRRAFLNGNRIRSLKITLMDGKKRRHYTLPLKDQMGWQRVAFPRQKANEIAIEFAEMVKFGKPVCSSGLGLLDGTREIKWNMPRAVMFSDGTGGDVSPLWLIHRDGTLLDGIALDAGYGAEWSRDGRFVAGFNGGGSYVWVADMRRGKIIKEIASPPKEKETESDYKWISPNQLRVTWTRPDKKNNWKPFQTKIYRF